MQYIFTSKTNNGKSPCVSLISHVLSQKMRYTLLHVFLYLHILAARKAFLQSVFPVFLLVFGHNLQYWEFKNRYSKKLVYVTIIDISDHIYQLIYISLWFYCSGFGCQISSKMTAFRPKMWILWHNANSLELIHPENDWPWHCPTTFPKAK